MSNILFKFSELYSVSNILLKNSSKMTFTQKLIVSKKFDSNAERTLRVTETGPSRIHTSMPIWFAIAERYDDNLLW